MLRYFRLRPHIRYNRLHPLLLLRLSLSSLFHLASPILVFFSFLFLQFAFFLLLLKQGELFHFLSHFSLFFGFIFFDEFLALAGRVHIPVLVLDPAPTHLTLLRFDTARLDMRMVVLHFECLVAVGAGTGPPLTCVLVVTELALKRRKTTVLALPLDVFSGFMLFFFSFLDDHAALFALILEAFALDVVHAELAHFDLLFAISAKLGLFSFSHISLLFKQLIIKLN